MTHKIVFLTQKKAPENGSPKNYKLFVNSHKIRGFCSKIASKKEKVGKFPTIRSISLSLQYETLLSVELLTLARILLVPFPHLAFF